MATERMQAVRVHEYGGPEVLRLEEISRPTPGADEILVCIHAAGVLPIEVAIRSGAMRDYMPKTFPYIPGTAFSGVVVEIGTDVSNFAVGDAVCGRIPSGTYAEYATVRTNVAPPDAAAPRASISASIIPLAHKPDALTHDEAATLSGGATTAWTALFDDGGLKSGQRVLIHGAAGGVGLYAVQFAVWAGARVTGTASAANLDFVRALGAENAIDYRAAPFEDSAGMFDFVLDTIGGDTLLRSMGLVKPGGTLVSVYEEPPQDKARERGIRAFNNRALPETKHLQQILRLIEAGSIKPHVQRTFQLEEAAAAHALVGTGHGRGRVVLHIAD